MALPAEKKHFTFADCLAWDEKERAEIIGGEVFMMAPPSSEHQRVCVELTRQFANYLEGKNAGSIRLPSASGCLSRLTISRKMSIPWSNRTSP